MKPVKRDQKEEMLTWKIADTKVPRISHYKYEEALLQAMEDEGFQFVSATSPDSYSWRHIYKRKGCR